MEKIAQSRGGRCLSASYKNGHTPLLWECRLGHRWRASSASVKSGPRRKGTWCRQCYNVRRTFRPRYSIEEMRTVAAERGGLCLSSEYRNSKTKLLWQCSQNHQWHSTPSSVVHGTWCPSCSRNRPLTLEALRRFAAARGGKCLSRDYTNSRGLLLWSCAVEHRWKASAMHVKRGSWCPACARSRRKSEWLNQAERRQPHAFRGTTLDQIASKTLR
jgi:hypothetical protein